MSRDSAFMVLFKFGNATLCVDIRQATFKGGIGLQRKRRRGCLRKEFAQTPSLSSLSWPVQVWPWLSFLVQHACCVVLQVATHCCKNEASVAVRLDCLAQAALRQPDIVHVSLLTRGEVRDI